MGLRESPYSSRILGGLDTIMRALLFPGYWLTSEVLALQQTTGEQPGCVPHALEVAVRGPPLLLLLLLYSPIALLAFLLWLPLQGARRPFAYQHTPGRASPELWALPGPARTLSLLTANVCLLPEGLAKFSNLWRTRWRASHLGQLLAQAAQCSSPYASAGAPNGLRSPHWLPGRPAGVLSHPPGDAVVTMEPPLMEEVGALAAEANGPREISACFPPNMDIVCLQEVFDPRASAHLCRFLGPQYEHIIYDVGTYGLPVGPAPKLLNSGLFLASRYPLLAVEFHCYSNGSGEDAMAAKGLLCAQVSQPGPPWAMEGRSLDHRLLRCHEAYLMIRGALDDLGLVGPLKVFPLVAPSEVKEAQSPAWSAQVQLGACQGRRVIGYLNCTHLQAPEADGPIRCQQLSLCLLWMQLFQDSHAQPGDVVAFDIFCGDFNFDTCSPGDGMEQSHEIFNWYTDPCRIGPRKDHPWAIGTLLNTLHIYDEAVATPGNLKR
ncbi:hypothetical protein Chor_010548 [Crotalus horridus]